MFKRLFSRSRMTRECPVRFYEGPQGLTKGSTHQKLLLLSVVLLASASNLALAGGLEWLEKADGKEYLFDDGDFRGRGIKVFAKVVKGGYITSNSQLQQLDEIISSRDAVLERLQSAVKALQG